MSIPKVSALMVMIIYLLICSNVNNLTAVTRNLFAFARKGGFPYLTWIATVGVVLLFSKRVLLEAI